MRGGDSADIGGWADGDAILVAVEAHVLAALAPTFGIDSGRAGVSFLGVERIDVLRFGPAPDGSVRYVTMGLSRHPMADPSAVVVTTHGPRAELVLAVRATDRTPVDRLDTVLRSLATLAASPAVEGFMLVPGSTLELGEPLWDGAAFTAVLIEESDGTVPDLITGKSGVERVQFRHVVPLTRVEVAHKRVHGPASLHRLWTDQGIDPRDPDRPCARVT